MFHCCEFALHDSSAICIKVALRETASSPVPFRNLLNCLRMRDVAGGECEGRMRRRRVTDISNGNRASGRQNRPRAEPCSGGRILKLLPIVCSATKRGMMLKRTVPLLAIMLTLGSGCVRSTTQPLDATLRYDGVYMSGKEDSDDESYRRYLRFYPDGEVIQVSSTGQPQDIRKWFSKERTDLSRGKVTVKGKRIFFSAVSAEGAVDYTGEADGDQLHLDHLSHINHYRGRDVYVFVKWRAEQSAPADADKLRR